MEIKKVSYNPESRSLFKADCEFCHHTWYPFENTGHTIEPPIEILLECPKCEKNTVHFFADSKMRKEILHRKYVLGYDQKIETAKKKIETLTKERDEWKNNHDKLFENNIKLTNAIDKLAKKLEQIGVEVDDDDKNPLSA